MNSTREISVAATPSSRLEVIINAPPIEDTRSSRTSEPSVVSLLVTPHPHPLTHHPPIPTNKPRCLHHQTPRSSRTLRPRLRHRPQHQSPLHNPLLSHWQLQRHLHRQQFLHSRPGSNRRPLLRQRRIRPRRCPRNRHPIGHRSHSRYPSHRYLDLRARPRCVYRFLVCEQHGNV